jgi:hypothetical protein
VKLAPGEQEAEYDVKKDDSPTFHIFLQGKTTDMHWFVAGMLNPGSAHELISVWAVQTKPKHNGWRWRHSGDGSNK